MFRSFEAGSIHSPEVYSFWEEELQAPEWTLITLKKGYLIPFRDLPEKYEERNNKTARDNMTTVRRIIAEMIAQNIVKVVKKKPIASTLWG